MRFFELPGKQRTSTAARFKRLPALGKFLALGMNQQSSAEEKEV